MPVVDVMFASAYLYSKARIAVSIADVSPL